jgi:SAM-dependent methyltransferase
MGKSGMSEDEDRWDHNKWARISVDYERNFAELPRELFMEVALLRASPPIRRLLYVGSGDGKALVYLHRRLPGAEIVGIDPDPVAVKLARARVGNWVKITKSAIEDLPGGLGRFDLVLSYMNLHLWRDGVCGLQRVQDSLSEDGMAYILDLRRDVPEQVRQSGLESLPHERFRSVFAAQLDSALSLSEVQSKLEAAGIDAYRLLSSVPWGRGRGGTKDSHLTDLARRMSKVGLSRTIADAQIHLFVYPQAEQ